MDEEKIVFIINENYDMHVKQAVFFRDGGSLSYTVESDKGKYFLRIVRPQLMDTAVEAVKIQLFLMEKHLPVSRIISDIKGEPYVSRELQGEKYLYILYEYIEGTDPGPEDMEQAGELVGRLHNCMEEYGGELKVRDKYFFIDRYIAILRKKKYARADEFEAYGNEAWDKVKHLPSGYCHGDLYRNNIFKADTGELYVLDFDTSCRSFPVYDIALFCNETDYFTFHEDAYDKTVCMLEQFLKGYQRHRSLSREEKEAIFDLLAVYHFQLQATIIEIYGSDCVDDEFLDNQLDWLYRWKAQCASRAVEP